MQGGSCRLRTKRAESSSATLLAQAKELVAQAAEVVAQVAEVEEEAADTVKQQLIVRCSLRS